jgi:dTMP kinase
VKIIALEGPSYAGKSTAIRHLRRRGIEDRVFVSDCYVQHIACHDEIPPVRTASAAQQLTAFETFMRIEKARVRDASAAAKAVVILDRSVDTLLAHAYALDAMFGYDVHQQVRHVLRDRPFLRPHHTLYLDVPADVLSLRRKATAHPRPESEYFLHEPEFLAHTRDYFVSPAPVSEEVTVMPADVPPRDVAHAVESLIAPWIG